MNTSLLGFIGPIGGPEMIMIFVVILLLFGAKKLPELARGVGKSMGEFKKARDEFEREITLSEEETRREKRKEKSSGDDTEAKVKPAAGNESHDA
jgi:sec-independent protein translocase protein TatA